MYNKYPFLFLPVVGTELAASRWLHLEELFDQTPYPLHNVSFMIRGAFNKFPDVFGKGI